MIARKNELLDTIGRAMFIAFFMVILSSFSDSSAEQSREPMLLEQAEEYLSDNSNAIIVDMAKVPDYSQHLVISIDKLNLNTFNKSFKTIHDRRIVLQKINLLKNLALTIKPIPIYKYSLHLFSGKSDDNPVLS